MLDYGMIALGAVLGAWLRFGVARLWPVAPGDWPKATLAVNLAGALLIGAFYGFQQAKGASGDVTRLFFVVGFLGALTTFSTFSFETLTLLRQGQGFMALTYVLASNLGCFALAWLGWKLSV